MNGSCVLQHRSGNVTSILLVGAVAALVALPETALASGVPYELSNAGMPAPKAATAARPAPRSASGAGSHPSRDAVLVGGDNPGTATVIPGLPYTDSGTTCGFTDDYAFPCPGDPSGSPAPDVVYRFTPASDMCVNVSLCNSNYDSGLYIWQNAVGNLVACNDDACGPTGQQSRITGFQLVGGSTYYIVVDAYAECGNYTLSVSNCLPPCTPLTCPPGATAEGEPVCFTGYVDNTNGGCNVSPPVYTAITLPATICGQYGKYCSDDVFCFNIYRDTDWYQFVLAQQSKVHVCVRGEIPTQLDVVDASAGCPGTIVAGSLGFPLGCETFCEDLTLAAGTYWIFVAPQQDPSFPPCGSRYVLSAATVTTAVGDAEQPLEFALGQNAPNPARSGPTAILYSLPRETSVQLAIYGVRGELVRTLAAGPQGAGRQTVVWDGRDDAGRPVDSGVYFCRLVAGPFKASRTVVLVK